jgi:membrane protease YdiL (CAAX protease family)
MRAWSARLFTTAEGRIRLGWRLALFIVVAAFVALGAGYFLPPSTGLVGGAAVLLIGAVVAGWILLALDGRTPGALGFHLSREAPLESGLGLLLGIGLGLAVVALMALVGVVRWAPEPGGVVAWLSGALGALAFLALPAAAEEALLRGYPLQALAEAWGGMWAVVLTASVFGLLHLPNPGAGLLTTVNVVAAGLLLGAVYLRTSSLWWASGVHLGWNWAHGYAADVPVSGLEVVNAPGYEGVLSGPAWLGGGVFGPEGSILSTIVLLTATAACWWGPWLRPGPAAMASDPLYPISNFEEVSA